MISIVLPMAEQWKVIQGSVSLWVPTNLETGFLRDITGNRRFWPIKVTGKTKRKSWDITSEEVLQMWAEAKYLYGQGEPLYLNMEESSEALSEQIMRWRPMSVRALWRNI